MHNCNAVYFDGISSRPHQLELALDTDNSKLNFEFDSTGFSLPLNEIEVTQSGGVTEVRFLKNSAGQVLKISDPEFIRQLQKARKEKGYISLYSRLTEYTLKSYILIAVGLLALISLTYLFVLPEIAEKAVTIIPMEYDDDLGSTFFDNYIASAEVDSEKTELLTAFTSKLDLKNSKELKFTVVQSETVNAFALPDGNIIVFTGLLDKLENYSELAGLCCHEAAHVNNRHSMKMICRNSAGYLFISAVFSDVNGLLAVIGDNVHTLQSLSYSRAFEKEADKEALELLVLNNINPNGLSQLFTHLDSDDDNFVPGFLNTHPLTKDRIRYAKEMSDQNSNNTIVDPELSSIFSNLVNQ